MLVEDGTGVPNATSYVNLVFADDYFAKKGVSVWATLTDERKEGLLESGTRYCDSKYGSKLQGVPLNLEQGLEFPRHNLTDRYSRPITGVPLDVKIAACEYALLDYNGQLFVSGTSVEPGLKSKTTKVGPITTAKEYQDSYAPQTYVTHSYPDSLMATYVQKKSGGTIRN